MNPYQILGLPNHASFEDVRKKYLKSSENASSR